MPRAEALRRSIGGRAEARWCLAGPEGVVFAGVDFALLHVEEADEAFAAVAGGFEDDGFGGAHDAAGDAVADLEGLAVALADEELVDLVGIDADALEIGGIVAVEEGLELGFVRRAAPIVLRLVGDIEVRQPLDDWFR